MRTGWIVVGAVAVSVALGGCTAGGDEAKDAAVAKSAPAWSEPATYDFVVERKCGSAPSEGRYHVYVKDKQVKAADRIDGTTASGEEEVDVPSLSGLLELAQTAADDGGQTTTKLDPADGHPLEVDFGPSADQLTCWVVSDYRPGN